MNNSKERGRGRGGAKLDIVIKINSANRHVREKKFVLQNQGIVAH